MITRGETLVLILLLQDKTVQLSTGSVEEFSMAGIMGENETKLRHINKKNLLQTRSGKYTTREEIQKAPSEDHPCRPTKTSVKITFPDMKSEVFVNFLGYKEPNLMQLLRCKGRCSSTNEEIDCVATRVRQKRVKMTVKTTLIGRDPREKMKEMLLDEHVDCGCQCKHISSLSCRGRFNNETCECECDEQIYKNKMLSCELAKNSYWDTTSCQCKSKSVSTRGVDPYTSECVGPDSVGVHDTYNQEESISSEVVSWVLFGCCLTTCIFLAASTFYYHRKVRNLVSTQLKIQGVQYNNGGRNSFENPVKENSGNHRRGEEHLSNITQEENHTKEKLTEDDGKLEKTSRKSRDIHKTRCIEMGEIHSSHTPPRLPQQPQQKLLPMQPIPQQQALPRTGKTLEEILLWETLTQGGELYHEQYNEHGVMIEKNLSDHDLIQKYLG
ncbi:uncharacterized protein LOC111705872 isoform X2 [Eurytemora carolleeae]|uniref:uncharacterized protein LOC111705872 isoform X2 n=1 Tax=Eurytemora carolleeae TaxID=1294199 RepID=UPI000C78E7B7|nr:uncharacterized protein LOC111705872 isoform X2 [Eurytemora carolleeae]|eukprot:XP_023334338.1 uncharacterized protein LOC111705872 isoform X2 [Eurytemora affinis]